VVGNVTHAGDHAFFRLKAGVTNNFTLTGGGTAVISYRAAHL
jgi:hypothetical protein